ncbi:hypothetical protein K402DRAFT_260866 [Aulographum hederae CBS 113979]|uniref:DUF7896 domain-containing protein n=1 Tax=Aulographum hederae CBS 113979 TaxID=1176131 RepID=A0A6G1H8Z2_9PEZI|nr:hypothetical protein K402DRAFT_260866 [Aulographum hederae CBS 113979]
MPRQTSSTPNRVLLLDSSKTTTPQQASQPASMAQTSTSPTNFIAETIRQAKQSFWESYCHLPESARETAWAALLRDTGSADQPKAPHVPRTVSFAGFSSVPDYATGSMPHSMSRNNGLSSQSAPAAPSMTRNDSLQPHESKFDHQSWRSSSPHWQRGDAEPFNMFMFNNNNPRHSPMPPVDEVDVYENPLDFLSTFVDPTSTTQSPIVSNTFLDHNRLTVNTQQSQYTWSPSYDGFPSPSTTTTGELTTASTQASEMSRHNSIGSSSFMGAFDLLRMHSNSSALSDFNNTTEDILSSSAFVKSNGLTSHDPSSFVSHHPPSLHHSSDFVQGGERLLSPSSSAQFPTPSHSNSNSTSTSSSSATVVPSICFASQSSSLSESNEAFKMERSSSSISSCASPTRQTRRHQEQLAQASRTIAPKSSGSAANTHTTDSFISSATSTETISTSADHTMLRIRSSDGTSKDVAAIAKTPYIRPQHPRQYCHHCDQHPEGFRGEHELRRHTERVHMKTRKVWVTVDASSDGKWLSNCKACRNGKKYGAYYNAAAHLRRAHFFPRRRGRKARGAGEEKRGGKGGGDQPAMELLKSKWMKEVEEEVLPGRNKKTKAGIDTPDDLDEEDDVGENEDEAMDLEQEACKASPRSPSSSSPRSYQPQQQQQQQQLMLSGSDPTSASASASAFDDLDPHSRNNNDFDDVSAFGAGMSMGVDGGFSSSAFQPYQSFENNHDASFSYQDFEFDAVAAAMNNQQQQHHAHQYFYSQQ